MRKFRNLIFIHIFFFPLNFHSEIISRVRCAYECENIELLLFKINYLKYIISSTLANRQSYQQKLPYIHLSRTIALCPSTSSYQSTPMMCQEIHIFEYRFWCFVLAER